MGEFRADAVRCVWTGYPSDGCSCRSSIPAGAVAAAWQRELAQGRARADRFFHVTWEGGAWLAYGLKDGLVRGVYCPSHHAERDERSFVADERSFVADSCGGEPTPELALIA